MGNLPAAILLEKNRIASPNAWPVLVTINIDADTIIRLARNNEDIIFNGNTFSAFPFEIDVISNDSKGSISTVTMRISNVTRLLQGYMEELNGGIGCTLLIQVVNSGHLDQDFSDLDLNYEIVGATAEVKWVTLILGAPNPMLSRYPLYRDNPLHCGWIFNCPQGAGIECGYSGSETTCNRTLDRCRELGNSARFGGSPGLAGGGIRLAY